MTPSQPPANPSGRLLIVSAPSGTGKSTIVGRLLQRPELRMRFSVSATSRPPRGQEQHGKDYWFMSPEEFRSRIARGDFLEYEEVFPGRYYGTLRSEVDAVMARGETCVLDIDVNGALRVKEIYGSRALALFIAPPSIEALRQRLEGRATESPEEIESRLQRAAYELEQAPRFDRVIVNDDLDHAVAETLAAIQTTN